MTDHDFRNPLSYLNAVEIMWLAADSTVPRCPHCHVTYEPLPMQGTAWGLDVHHERECPEHEDNQPANVTHVRYGDPWPGQPDQPDREDT